MPLDRSLMYASLSALAFAAACGGGTTEPEPNPVMAAVSGDGQTADVGMELADPLVVRITQDGAALSGRTVTWSVTAGGGSVDPTSSTTDASGNASTMWTLGPSAGANTVQASSSGVTGSPVTFQATGEDSAPPPTTASVSVVDYSFNPSSTTIAAGGEVTWTWGGTVGHNVTFSTGPNSATQTSGTFSRTFPTAGSYPYQCTIHSGMDGTIIVQ
jgi:plastocyanin